VTTIVHKPSATGQPTRPTQPFILSVLKTSNELELDVCYGATTILKNRNISATDLPILTKFGTMLQ